MSKYNKVKIKMNTFVGIVKEIDNLGRIVIPKEFRARFGLEDYVEIVATESGVLIRNPAYKLIKVNDNKKSDG